MTFLSSGVPTIRNNGTDVGAQRNINFVPGTNISFTITDDAGNGEVDIQIDASSAGYQTVQEEGVGLTQRDTMNFIGAGITAADNAGQTRTDVTLDAGLNDIAGLAVTDGNIIVGDGANWVAESGATARASLGLTIGTDVQAHGDVLDDLNTLGAATADGEFIVATGAGAFAYESGATARTSLGLGDLATLNTVDTAEIDDDAVTFAKMQDVSTDILFGRGTAGSGIVEEITIGTGLAMTGTTLEATGVATAYDTVEEETVALTQRTVLNFVGSGITASDNAGTSTTDVTLGDRLNEISQLAVTDGNIIVGDGAAFVAESGATARASLGLTIGTDVQAWDDDLDDLAALAHADGNIIVSDGTDWTVESGATARASLGLAIGTDVQAWDDDLDDLAALAHADGNFIVSDGTDWVVESGATARTSLGLGTIATQDANSVDIDGGAIDGVTLGTNSAVTEAQIDNVNINGNAITSTDTNGDLTLTPDGTGDLVLDGLNWPQADGSASQVLSTDGAGQLSFVDAASLNIVPVGMIRGPHAEYTSASTVTIKSGYAIRNTTNTHNIIFASDAVVDITASGANGLDTGSEAASTHYYLYIIDDTSGTNSPAGLLSTTNEADTGTVTLPAGYDVKQQTPYFFRNDGSSDLLPVIFSGDMVYPKFLYNDHHDFVTAPYDTLGGNSTVTSFTATDLSALLPETCQSVDIATRAEYITATGEIFLRATGDTHDGMRQTASVFGATLNSSREFVPTNSSQSIDRRTTDAGTRFRLDVYGGQITTNVLGGI